MVKAIRINRTGGPEVLVLAEHPTPTPGPDEVLVRTEAVGVNFIDIYHRRGLYPQPLPMPIGQEGAGVIERIGGAVAALRVGDRVGWCGVPGSYATHVVVDSRCVALLPSSSISLREAAAIPIAPGRFSVPCR